MHQNMHGDTPRPAAGNGYGDTGRAIRMLLQDAIPLHQNQSPGVYPLIIFNAIPYICSLGCIKNYRDIVFSQCWNEFGKGYFESRMSSLYRTGDIVINACTRGARTPYLRELVRSSPFFNQTPANYRKKHPSSWQRIYNIAARHGCVGNYDW